MLDSLYKYAWVEGGLASIRSVNNMEQEDYMPSFFLAETCKYLFLLFNDTLRVSLKSRPPLWSPVWK